MCQRLALPGIRSEIGLEFLFREIPRINVLPRWCGVHREKRFARVLERRRNRALIQCVERQQIAGSRVSGFLEASSRRERITMSLLLVDVLEDAADLEQLRDGRSLSRGEVRQIRGEPRPR